jgi:hypothetical protein
MGDCCKIVFGLWPMSDVGKRDADEMAGLGNW